MEQSEVEKLIGELETALDRLRSLYEQYFVGIERIEPGVARKDVERRLYLLRKEQIRNTALRYRFQMVLQKFNTYQTHWLRICREIENGTYKRHMIRAQRRFGSTRPPRKRSSAPPPDLHPEPGAPLPREVAAQLAELDDEFAPASFEVDMQLGDESPSSRSPATRPLEIPPTGAPPLSPPAPVPPRPGVPALQPVWKKVAAPGAPHPPPVPPARAVQLAPVPPGRAPHPVPAPPVRAPPPTPLPPMRAPQPSQNLAAPAAPAAQPAQRPAQPGPPSALPPRPGPPRPGPPGLAPHRPPSVVPPRPVPAPSDLSEKRLRQIYVEYVDAKRRQNESTAAITYQSVAKSLRESGEKLREKHGKAVDFEVAVKDGKTVLRPVLK